jgi:hypothetical protein
MSGPSPPRAYLVRDEKPATGVSHPDRVFPYTLRGLLDALDAGAWRSSSGTPQAVHVREVGKPPRLVRRYVNGREAPIA